MADLTQVAPQFNAGEVEPNTPFEAIPAGDYVVVIVDSNVKPTASGEGQLLELRLQVLRGDFKGRLLFDRLNLVNPSDKAVQIARATLSSICRAVDVMTPNDSSDMHDKPLIATVRRDISTYNGELANEVKGYKKVEGTLDKADADAANKVKDEIPF